MEKIIKVGEYEFAAKSTAASLISYKSNFKRDGLKDMISLAGSLPGDMEDKTDDEVIEALVESDFDFDVFYRFLWVFAKAGDKSIPPLEEWLEGFDIPPLDFAVGALEQVVDLLLSTAETSVKAKNSKAVVGNKK